MLAAAWLSAGSLAAGWLSAGWLASADVLASGEPLGLAQAATSRATMNRPTGHR
jgi:hypothetical protein